MSVMESGEGGWQKKIANAVKVKEKSTNRVCRSHYRLDFDCSGLATTGATRKERRQEEEKDEEKKKKRRRRREREREREKRRKKRQDSERGRDEKHRTSDGRLGILRLAFKIRNRWEAGEVLMTLAGPGPRWRNGREVEVRGRRRAQTAVSTDAPDLPHAAL
ncbi:hypothetical protein G5I_10113 [Acromyrmex echinatior]|uniref:Uncharacterized protein n=1 Tax=Acromyrmex echinatior TaxID=103372 RepID=F4WW79_ACREC|nr:hypothetical protein G5I_10113 [Acromyrmex echinatior]